MKQIIIGSDHYNTLGLIRSLGECGYTPIVIIMSEKLNAEDSLVKQSKYIKDFYIISRKELVTFLNTLDLDNDETVIFPASDSVSTILDSNYDSLKTKYILPNINNNQGALVDAINKENLRIKSEKFGFNTPKTCIISTLEEIGNEIPIPCVIKPLRSDLGAKDVHIYRTQLELLDGAKKLLLKSPAIQIQEFVEKEKEIIFLGWSVGEKVIIPCMMEKIREFPDKFGCTGFGYFTADINKYISSSSLVNFVKSYNYTGLFSIEFIISKGKAFFLEINFRNDGNGYFPGYGGVNLPATFIQELTHRNVNQNILISKSYYMMREFTDFDYMRKKPYSIKSWLRDIRRTNVFQIWNKKDNRPFLFMIKKKMLSYLKR